MKWHRRIGWSSVAIVPALVISALLVVLDALGPDVHFPRDLLLTLVWIDLWSLGLFSLLWVMAIANRRRWRLHARYVGCTVFVAIIPALGRLYGMNIAPLGGLSGALHPSFLTVEAVLVARIVRDRVKGGPALPYWLTLIGLGAVEATMFAAPYWTPFVRVMESLRGAPSA